MKQKGKNKMIREIDNKVKVYLDFYEESKAKYKKDVEDFKKTYIETSPRLAEAIEKSKQTFNLSVAKVKEKILNDIDEAEKNASDKINEYVTAPISSELKATLEAMANVIDSISIEDLEAMNEKCKYSYVADCLLTDLMKKKRIDGTIIKPSIDIAELRESIKDYTTQAKEIVTNFRGGAINNYDIMLFLNKKTGETISIELEKIPTIEDK